MKLLVKLNIFTYIFVNLINIHNNYVLIMSMMIRLNANKIFNIIIHYSNNFIINSKKDEIKLNEKFLISLIVLMVRVVNAPMNNSH
ncbi:hypothetical protein BpHYR1_019156 [Brachionus plicatilis]|uniref:Uncharacterized protein n=1 Tax=Brachionus plicatilis TaxID=10195 RepID=A0A3M7PE33_BRAPC|nr:hypothetical protein BpHYR1_019156 [Brachionus plicatilis]